MHQSKPLGDRIKAVRGALNQDEFAQALGVNRNTLRTYERGTSQPNAIFLADLSSKFHVNPTWILFGEGSMYVDGRQEGPPPVGGGVPAETTPGAGNDEAGLWQEIRDLRQENRELRQENRALLKENGDLRVALAELKPRAAPKEGSIDGLHDEASRRSA